MVKLGLWLDDPVTDIKKKPYWRELQRHGFSVAAIMLEGVGNGFDPKYSVSDLCKIRDLANEVDIEVALTCWPQPDKKYLDEFKAEIGAYLTASGAKALEADLESNWIASKVSGFPNLKAASDYLVAIFVELRKTHGIRVEVTTFTGHAENSSRATVADDADRLLPQAYSVRNRSTGQIAWDGLYGPGRMQEFTLKKALEVPGEQELACGLAAYDQVWPGKTGEEAMQVAYEAALKFNPTEIRLWSSKWVVGMKKNGYASRWVLSLKGK